VNPSSMSVACRVYEQPFQKPNKEIPYDGTFVLSRQVSYFFDQMPWLLFLSLHATVWLHI